jgi:hypothetical protein
VLVEYPDRTDLIDFVVPTVDDALALINGGATNGRQLLKEAGLSSAEAEAELARIIGV